MERLFYILASFEFGFNYRCKPLRQPQARKRARDQNVHRCLSSRVSGILEL